MSDLRALKHALVAHGRSVGLDLIGVAPASPFIVEGERLQRRREAGHGPVPFEWQDPGERVDPERILPGVQSIVAAGISYLMADPEPDTADQTGPHGWLSRYCRGRDYHHVLRERLDRLAQWLRAQSPGTRTVVHLDTGPLLDRSVAERAGIGKWGKHTNLITPAYGTWVFLGHILTDLALPPDEPVEAACGSCTLCLDACPTQCLTEWELDANRCLSYITQIRGSIPTEFRAVMGNRLFGCDDCQDVCPYNKKARLGLHPEFAPAPDLGAEPDLLKLLAMTKGDFKRWFEPTAAAWRGKTTIVRNAIVALGNAGDPQAVEPLEGALNGESPTLRAHAAWALGRLAHLTPATEPDAMTILARRRERETDPMVQQEIDNALEELSHARSR